MISSHYKVRAGVVGAGVFGGYHAQKYAGLEGVDLVGIFDTDAERAATLAKSLNVKPYTDYKSFIEAVDVTSIAAPASNHFGLTEFALKNGVHCLVEKPLALDNAQARGLVDVAERLGVVLQVGHQERFVAEAAGLFDQLSAVRSATFRRICLPSGRCEDVSVTLDLMIHDLDLARQLQFGEPARIEATGDYNNAEACLWFDDGRFLRFAASRRAEVQERKVTIDIAGKEVVFDFVSKERSDGRRVDIADSLKLGVAKFVGAVRGENPVAVSGEDGGLALEWALLIEEERSGKGSVAQTRAEAVA